MLESCGLKAHPDKTVLCSDTVEFLGHNVSEQGLTPSEAKVAAIKALRPPTNVSQLRSVLGFVGYYRCYIPNFSKIAYPLNTLLKKSAKWEWGAEQQRAFDALKKEINTPGKVLRHQDPICVCSMCVWQIDDQSITVIWHDISQYMILLASAFKSVTQH